MSGIDFISPDRPYQDRPEFDRISLALVAPQPYLSENPLSEHMANAILWARWDLTLRKHLNLRSGKAFECISYYAEDPYVVAFCAAHNNVYLATIGAPFVWKLVKICSRIGLALHVWYQTRGHHETSPPQLKQDDTLVKLMNGSAEVSESEALEIVARWPAAFTQSAQLELGEYALFYDLIRLIWLSAVESKPASDGRIKTSHFLRLNRSEMFWQGMI
jgi:hypothetical protein